MKKIIVFILLISSALSAQTGTTQFWGNSKIQDSIITAYKQLSLLDSMLSVDYYRKAYIDAVANLKLDKADSILYYRRSQLDAMLAYKQNVIPNLSDTSKYVKKTDSSAFWYQRGYLDAMHALIKSRIDSIRNYLGISVNNIGRVNTAGFGVGIAPVVPAYMTPLSGYDNPYNDNYGNYQVNIDGSIMVWIPAFYYKILYNTQVPNYGNQILIASIYDFADETAANAAGYALHRAFINAGQIVPGFFVDKYDWSLTNFVYNTSGIASSIKYANPISSANTTQRNASNNYAGSFSNCKSNSQNPSDLLGGAWSVAKSRGDDFAVTSIFVMKALAMLSVAQAEAVSSSTFCTWYNSAQTINYPKGNNNYGADIDDATCTYLVCDDNYWASLGQARKTGSGNIFSKTTHNGQNCGVADLNGNQLKILQGLTCIATSANISAVTTGSGIVTITTNTIHGLTPGQKIFITGAVGMTDLNDKVYTVSTVTSDYIFVVNLSTSQTWTSGGRVTKGQYYIIKESVDIRNITGGNTLPSSDHFNTTFISNNMDTITVPLADGTIVQRYGNGTNQVLSADFNRTLSTYKLACAGLPMATTSVSTTGSNLFGKDYYYEYIINELCVIGSGYWATASGAGPWNANLSYTRSSAYSVVSGRSCLYVR